jgi:hypothetical protein
MAYYHPRASPRSPRSPGGGCRRATVMRRWRRRGDGAIPFDPIIICTHAPVNCSVRSHTFNKNALLSSKLNWKHSELDGILCRLTRFRYYMVLQVQPDAWSVHP